MISLCYKRLGADKFVSRICERCNYETKPHEITCRCGYLLVNEGYVSCLAYWDSDKRRFFPYSKSKEIREVEYGV